MPTTVGAKDNIRFANLRWTLDGSEDVQETDIATDHNIVAGYIANGEAVTVYGQYENDSRWLLVQTPRGEVGWVLRGLLDDNIANAQFQPLSKDAKKQLSGTDSFGHFWPNSEDSQ